MIKKLILLGVIVIAAIAILYAGDTADADRPGFGYVKMKRGLMSDTDFGLNLPDTSIAADTLFTKWVHDFSGKVSPWVCAVSISVDSIGAQTWDGKLYMMYANDTTDAFLVDSAKSGTVNDFDTTYAELLSGYAYYRWYWISTDSCLIEDFKVMWTGYR